MKHSNPLFVLALLGALALAVLLSASASPAQAQASPSVSVSLSADSVEPGTAITVTMSFGGLETDSDTATKDYIFRADVKKSDDSDVDVCEDQANGYGLGVDRYMWQVDEDPEVRIGAISAACPPGDYTVRASISSPDNVELASATAGFSVVKPEPPASTDATLSSLTLSGVTLEFDSATTEVGNDVAETAVTATTNDDGATYMVKLDGVEDADGTVPLAVGENVITVEVTAEDGNTVKTYTVTVTRAEVDKKGQMASNSPKEDPQPSVTVTLYSAGLVIEGTAITVTMSFSNLETDSDTSTIDYTFQANVVDSDGNDADACESAGFIGVGNYIRQVDEDPEERTGWISNDGSTDTDIAGATNRAYTPVPTDEGKTIKVRMSFTDDNGQDHAYTSTPTATVTPAIPMNTQPEQQEENQQQAETGPTVAVSLSPPTAPVGTTIDVTMTFATWSTTQTPILKTTSSAPT